MPSYVKSLSVDCASAAAAKLASFWAAALVARSTRRQRDKASLEAPGWGGPNLWFTAVPEPKVAKNRVHLDLRAPDGDVAAEVARLEALGASVMREGSDLVVMLDPAGNEFCVET